MRRRRCAERLVDDHRCPGHPDDLADIDHRRRAADHNDHRHRAEAPGERAAAPTIDELVAGDEPLAIAHAGGDQSFPHSTPYAFAQSAALGVDVLELDVQLTRDGVLVVHHDDTVDKTTEASGPVVDLTLAEIQALDNAHWFSPECWPCQDRPTDEYVWRGVRTSDRPPPPGFTPDDFAVATFEHIATRFATFPLDIEIKGEGEAGIAAAQTLAAELRRLDRLDSVVVVSFDSAVLAAFSSAAPEVATSPGVDEMIAWALGVQPLDGQRIIQIPPEFEGVPVLDEEVVDRAHAEGLAVWVWPSDAATQENEAFYRELLALGVDGVIAGRPAEMLAARDGG